MTTQDQMFAPYYSTDLDIPIVQIYAKNKHHAEAIINEFIDQLSPVMELKIRWEECDWEIQENVFIASKGVWITK
jgi:hypothetical protein